MNSSLQIQLTVLPPTPLSIHFLNSIFIFSLSILLTGVAIKRIRKKIFLLQIQLQTYPTDDGRILQIDF